MANSVPHRLGGARRAFFVVLALTSPAAWVPDAAADGGGDGGGGGGSGQLRLSVDSASELLLNLYACKGGAAPRKLAANYSMCHDGAHEPLQRVRPQAATPI